MKFHSVIFALAAITAPIAAHADPAASGPVNPQASEQAAASSAASQGVATSATFRDQTAPIGSPANPEPLSSPTPVDQASGLTAGDTSVVSNGPVPDTAANRARYGSPMSHAGRVTTPAGN
jgi:hypothetical protein